MRSIMENRDLSILTQVAFKAAIETMPVGNDPMARSNFIEHLSFLTDALVSEVESRIGNKTTPAVAPAHLPDVPATALAQVQQVFPEAQPVVQQAPAMQVGVQIKGKVHGDMPAWLITAASAKGVSSVWDERDKLSQNPKRPWFRSTENKDVCFWPPKD